MNKPVGKIRSALIRWLIPEGLSVPQMGALVGPSNYTAGQTVTESTTLSLSAAWACARLISEAIGTLPITLYQRTAAGRQEVTGTELSYLLTTSPNRRSTPSQFWSAIVASMLLRGNGFAEKHYVAGRLRGVTFLHPALVMPKLNENGSLVGYRVYSRGQQDREVSVSNMLHIPAFGLDGQWGLSTIRYGASVFGNALASASAANGTFENGLAQTTALTLDRVISKEKRKEYREAMRKISGALNAGKPAVLEGGMDVKTIGINPKDAQLLESRTFSVEEVCRWFGVDPSMVGHGAAVSNWGTGLEQKMIGFSTFTLRPLITRIEQSIKKQLLENSSQYVKFNIEGLLRADSAGRASYYSTMVNDGIYTRDEVRAKEDMPLRGGNSDKQTIQSGFVPLETIGEGLND